MKCIRNEENFWMNGRNTSVAKWSISWDGTFCSEVNHRIVVKLNTGCVQKGWAGPALGLTQRNFFFLEPVTLTPTWMRSMFQLAARVLKRRSTALKVDLLGAV